MESWKKEERIVKIKDYSSTLHFEGSDLQIGVLIDVEPNFEGYKSKIELYPYVEDSFHKETIERDTLEKAQEDSLKIVFDKVYNFLSEIGEYLNLKVSYMSNEEIEEELALAQAQAKRRAEKEHMDYVMSR